MKIDHIAIYTANLEALKLFYIKYFNASSNSMYHNPKTGLKTYFLMFENGARLEIMSRPDITENAPQQSLGIIHIAFSVKTKTDVDTLTNRLAKDGYTILSAPRTTGDGYYESCVLDPDGNQLEIVAGK
ncbi:lactoylglutathione lyase [Elusimicrobium simillimum]|uniref:VOC family protein n=1 Tax=Elusimicrobium simillimum TaxID=3143438 RepID=UPI003C703AC7